MIIDANNFDPDRVIRTDICIIGSGAAGITLAKELANTGTSITLLESGGRSDKKQHRDLLEGEVEAGSRHPPVDLYRRRMVGGTTSVWGGRCIPYDDIDFEQRDYIPYSGWPLTRAELNPFYQRANRICDAGEFDYNARDALGTNAGDMIPGFSSAAVPTDGIERFSLPTHFGRRYRTLLRKAPNITLVCNATCVNIEMQDNGNHATRLAFKNYKGGSFTVQANKYVLAMGGLETTRLLLSSNDVMQNGIGNDSGTLGRFYMCHLALTAGELRLSPNISHVIYDYEKSRGGVYCRRRLSISEDIQRKHRIGNAIARLFIPNASNPEHGNGILSTLFLAKGILQPEYRSAFSPEGNFSKDTEKKKIDYSAHLKNILLGLPQTLVFSQMIISKRFLARRKLPSIQLKSTTNTYPLDLNAEQSPNPDSRITLAEGKDRFGVPKLHIDWRTNDLDRHTVRTSLEIFRDEFTRTGCGTLLIEEDRLEDFWPVGGHHIGTTRMSSSPDNGVVDENCRIHGVSNLYIAGSSVFPTASHANPTLTIVALAARLADHLKQILK